MGRWNVPRPKTVKSFLLLCFKKEVFACVRCSSKTLVFSEGLTRPMVNLETMDSVLELPPVLDLVAASTLLEALLRRRGETLVVDGSAVERLGAQCLQVLLAARAAWAADEQSLRFANGSEDFVATLELLGVAPETLTSLKETAQ
jgi:chemotaxis protein CheX